MRPHISSFASVFIVVGFSYIIFLLVYIGAEILRVQETHSIIERREREVKILEKKRNERLQTKYIMLSPQYQDRIAKESRQMLKPGEKEFILPEVSLETEVPKNPYEQTLEEINRSKTPQEQWADVFFGHNT